MFMAYHEGFWVFSDFLECFPSFLPDFGTVCFFDGILPHYKLFETQAQFIVVTKELRVRWDLIQEDLGHFQRALQRGAERGGKGRKGRKQRDQVRETKK